MKYWISVILTFFCSISPVFAGDLLLGVKVYSPNQKLSQVCKIYSDSVEILDPYPFDHNLVKNFLMFSNPNDSQQKFKIQKIEDLITIRNKISVSAEENPFKSSNSVGLNKYNDYRVFSPPDQNGYEALLMIFGKFERMIKVMPILGFPIKIIEVEVPSPSQSIGILFSHSLAAQREVMGQAIKDENLAALGLLEFLIYSCSLDELTPYDSGTPVYYQSPIPLDRSRLLGDFGDWIPVW